jgi:uncharacterized protein (TIGR01777 family)
MRVAVTGGTGIIGKPFVQALADLNHEVFVLTRNADRNGNASGASSIKWSPSAAGDWCKSVERMDVIVHLARSRFPDIWTPLTRREFKETRLGMIRNVVEAISRLSSPPETFICASSHDFYGARDGTLPLPETAPAGNDFLAELYAELEGEAWRVRAPGLRVVQARFGAVLGPGAVNPKWMPYAVSDPHGALSWIHTSDCAGALCHLISDPAVSGPVNITAQEPTTAASVWTAAQRELGKLNSAYVPRWNRSDQGELLFQTHWAYPKILENIGYRWRASAIESALSYLACPDQRHVFLGSEFSNTA